MAVPPTSNLTSALIRRLKKVMYSDHGGKSKNRGQQVDVFKIISNFVSKQKRGLKKKKGLDSHQILRT